MKLLLVSNYAPDRQQSMLRFGELLRERGLARGWQVSVIAPEAGALTTTLHRVLGGRGAKWLGYFDKYVVFQSRLARRVRDESGDGKLVVHIVDHSNAVYVPTRSHVPWVVTCHDLLAVRGALGEDTDCPASALGRRLQRAIVHGLGRATALAADSTSTLQDVERLVIPAQAQRRRMILLGLNHPYARVSPVVAQARLASFAHVPWSQPYLLHVGSNLARKNKAGVLRVFARVAKQWAGNLVFCGAELTPELRAQAVASGLAGRIFAATALDNGQLEAAYNLAHALVFPSKCEGFGWPVIEAQACGCPVVCSDRTSLPEIGGEAALVHALEDEAGMAESVLRLTDSGFRAGVIARGVTNLERFTLSQMLDSYEALYQEAAAAVRAR